MADEGLSPICYSKKPKSVTQVPDCMTTRQDSASTTIS